MHRLLLLAPLALSASCTVTPERPLPTRDAGPMPDVVSIDANVHPNDVYFVPVDAPLDTTCASVRVDARQVTPNVIVIVDQSASMNEDFGGPTRWEALHTSLLAMPDGPLFSLETEIRFGVVMYTDTLATAGCPDLLTLSASLGDYDAISAFYGAQAPLPGLTPTGAAIQGVLSRLTTLAPDRSDPTVLILATDGEPNTCADPYDLPGGRTESLAAIGSAYAMGIETFVVSVGTEITTPHLQALANAGQGLGPSDPPAQLWVANDTDGLDTALSTIVTAITSCELELNGRIVDLDRACSGTVGFEGDVPLACGTEWRAVDDTHIELLGAACDRLLHTRDPFSATFPCDVIVF